jgi:hypothetical protein
MATMPQQMQFAQQPNAFAQRMAPMGGRPPQYQPFPFPPNQQRGAGWGGVQAPVQMPPIQGMPVGGQPPQAFPQPQPMQPWGGPQPVTPPIQPWGGQPPIQQQPMPNAYARFMQPGGQNG